MHKPILLTAALPILFIVDSCKKTQTDPYCIWAGLVLQLQLLVL